MSLFEREDIKEALGSIIKIGEVSSVDAAKGTASVIFDDDDSIVVTDLQVIQRNTFANRDYAMPDIGEDVICLFLPSGTVEGFILGSVYADEIEPPEDTIDKRTVEFSDETRISYDRAAHELTVTIKDTQIVANQDKTEIKSGGVTFTLEGNKATVQADDIELSGNTSIKGDLSVSGKADITGDLTAKEVKAGANTLTGHTHNYTCSFTGATVPTQPPLG